MTTQKESKVLVIAGPSGSGKNSILDGVVRECDECARLVTATTRELRAGEEHGKDYYFITKEEFQSHIKDETIPEYWYAPETDRYYGTYLPDLEQKAGNGKVVVAQMQAEGIKYFKENFKTLAVLVTADSDEALIKRILGRHPMTDEELQERIDLVHQEMEEFEPLCDYHVYNADGKLEGAVQEVITILKKEGYVN